MKFVFDLQITIDSVNTVAEAINEAHGIAADLSEIEGIDAEFDGDVEEVEDENG